MLGKSLLVGLYVYQFLRVNTKKNINYIALLESSLLLPGINTIIWKKLQDSGGLECTEQVHVYIYHYKHCVLVRRSDLIALEWCKMMYFIMRQLKFMISLILNNILFKSAGFDVYDLDS